MIKWALIPLLAGLAVGAFIGHKVAPTKITVIDHTKEMLALRQQLAEAQQENTQLKRHTVKRVVTKFSKEGKPVERVATEDTHTDRSTDTRAAVRINTEATAAKLTDSTTVTENAPVWFVGPLVVFTTSLPAGQQFSAGLVVGRYLGTLPLIKVPVSGSVSFTVPVHKPVSVPSFGLSLTFGF